MDMSQNEGEHMQTSVSFPCFLCSYLVTHSPNLKMSWQSPHHSLLNSFYHVLTLNKGLHILETYGSARRSSSYQFSEQKISLVQTQDKKVLIFHGDSFSRRFRCQRDSRSMLYKRFFILLKSFCKRTMSPLSN